jgi:hypothetical protein
MLFSWGSQTLDATGSLSPTLPVQWAQGEEGGIRRTCIGTAKAQVLHRKMTYSFVWEQGPEEIVGYLNDMVSSGDTVVFTDSIMGTYNFRLIAGDLSVGSTLYGVDSIAATFREM